MTSSAILPLKHMGTYNTLHAVFTCPRCGAVRDVEVEMRFGYTAQMEKLAIGDRYPEAPRMLQPQTGEESASSFDGEGYMECEQCHKDSFLRVIVREDIIVGVEPDPDKSGYISD